MSETGRFRDGSFVFFTLVTAAILLTCVLGAFLSWIGIPAGGIAFLFVAAAVGFSLLRMTRADDADAGLGTAEAKRRVNGLIGGIEWLSAFGLFGITGALFAYGHDGLALILGLAAGFVVSTVAIAPRLRRIPARSMPDFLVMRYGGSRMRWAALGAMAVIALLFVSAQLVACGLIAQYALGLPCGIGILVGALIMLGLTVPKGFGGLTAAQVALSAIVLVGISIAAIWLLTAKTGIFVPQLAWGGLLADIGAAHDRLGIESEYGAPFAMLGGLNVVLLTLSLALGSAAMPVFIFRVSAESDVMETRATLVRGLTVFLIAATALPALAVLARTELLSMFMAGEGVVPLQRLFAFVGEGSSLCGVGAEAPDRVLRACAEFGFDGAVPLDELNLDPQGLLLMLPALSGGSYWLFGLLAAVGLAAALAAGGGALHAFADAVTSRASPLDAASHKRAVLVGSALVCVLFSLWTEADVLSLGAWAFSIAAATLFAPLVFGLWGRTVTQISAFTGMIAGFVVVTVFILAAESGSGIRLVLWLAEVPSIAAGAVGCGAALFVTVWVWVMAPPPTPQERALVERLDRTAAGITEDPEAPE